LIHVTSTLSAIYGTVVPSYDATPRGCSGHDRLVVIRGCLLYLLGWILLFMFWKLFCFILHQYSQIFGITVYFSFISLDIEKTLASSLLQVHVPITPWKWCLCDSLFLNVIINFSYICFKLTWTKAMWTIFIMWWWLSVCPFIRPHH